MRRTPSGASDAAPEASPRINQLKVQRVQVCIAKSPPLTDPSSSRAPLRTETWAYASVARPVFGQFSLLTPPVSLPIQSPHIVPLTHQLGFPRTFIQPLLPTSLFHIGIVSMFRRRCTAPNHPLYRTNTVSTAVRPQSASESLPDACTSNFGERLPYQSDQGLAKPSSCSWRPV